MKSRYNRRVRAKDAVMVALILIVSVFVIVKYNLLQEGFEQEVDQFGLGAVFTISFLLELIPQFFHPFSSVIFAAGVGVNIWMATGLSILGSVLGAAIGFEVGRRYGFRVICPFVKRRTLDRTLEKIDQYGPAFIIIAALLPVPYLPMVFGSVGLKRKTFCLYGMITRAVSFVCLGFLLHHGIRLL